VKKKMKAKANTPMPKFEMIPIETKGKSSLRQWWVMITRSRKIRLTENYILFVGFLNLSLMAPKGFVTNLASVPRWLWWLIPPDGIFMVASIFHDFFYQYRCLLTSGELAVFFGESKSFGDKMFKKINCQINGMDSLDGLATKILNLFGWKAWRRCRKGNDQKYADYPRLKTK